MNNPAASVEEALRTRKSVRAFRADKVSRATLEAILETALRAPSGGNLQPWRIYALMDGARDALVEKVAEYRKTHPMGDAPEYAIYPENITEPYKTRRFKIGEAMYAALGIPREDKAARLAFFLNNWKFFGAPVGLIFTMDRQMGLGQWNDLGMLMQSICLLARAHGLHTCPQEAWAPYHRVLREHLSIPDNEMVFCGMAIGYADESHPANALHSERAPLEEIVTFIA